MCVAQQGAFCAGASVPTGGMYAVLLQLTLALSFALHASRLCFAQLSSYDRTEWRADMHACMIEGLKVEDGDHVLDIGSGCGVTSALLAYLVRGSAEHRVLCLLVKDSKPGCSCNIARALPTVYGFTVGAVPALREQQVFHN